MPAPPAFHILGPLQVTHVDAPVPLGGPRERVLLAALVVEHGRVVSVDGLARALWGDHPPATARIKWLSASAGSARPSPRPGPVAKSSPPVLRGIWWRTDGSTPGVSRNAPSGPTTRWPRATARRPPRCSAPPWRCGAGRR